MKRKTFFNFSVVMGLIVALGVILATSTESADAQGVHIYEFSYQGYLADENGPVTGTCDMTFNLLVQTFSQNYEVLGTQVEEDVPVSDGYFELTLDFGDQFQTGRTRYLEIEVDCGQGLANLGIEPILAVPYALFARYTSPHNHMGETWTGEQGEALEINSVGNDALRVLSAGNPSTTQNSDRHNGLEVAGAQGFGLFVGHSDHSGLRVASTSGHGVSIASAEQRGVNVGSSGGAGVYITSAGGSGVYVDEAGNHGVRGRTISADYYGGNFINAAPGGVGLRARAGNGNTPDLILAGNNNSTSGDNGRISSDPDYDSSDLFLVSNDAVVIKLNNDQSNENDGSAFSIRDQNDQDLFRVQDNGDICIGNC